MFASKLGEFIQAGDYPGLVACSDGKERYWVEDADGKEIDSKSLPFTAEDVAAFESPAPLDRAAEVEAKLESAKSGTQAEKIAALRESVEALTAALKAKGVI